MSAQYDIMARNVFLKDPVTGRTITGSPKVGDVVYFEYEWQNAGLLEIPKCSLYQKIFVNGALWRSTSGYSCNYPSKLSPGDFTKGWNALRTYTLKEEGRFEYCFAIYMWSRFGETELDNNIVCESAEVRDE